MLEKAEALAELERQLLAGLPPPSDCHQIEWHINNVCTPEEIAANIQSSLKRGLPEFIEQYPPNDRLVSVIGSAPSINYTYKNIKGDVWACNNSGWKLREFGIIPKYWMIWDPQGPDSHGSPYHCLRDLHKDTTFLVCSMCDPAVFDKLKDFNVLLWHPHAGDNLPIMDWLHSEGSKCEQLVGFGLWIPDSLRGSNWYMTSAAVSRSMQFAPLMGYRTMEVHGMDSSVKDGKVHFELLHTDGNAKDLLHYYPFYVGAKSVPASKRPFVTTGQMYRQIEEFEPLMEILRDSGVKVRIHGDGAIPWLAMLRGWHANSA